ncbi:PAS domain S-box protein [Methanolobus profundi]|uniref:histidine kinase n=1 Tax=Methanolobus profundi TaxID=487685 RepID=A0A1I4TJW7_9EURY|nr:PAS domain S-box protein [Methanolobus profundi]SFM76933.1 PAS domain S-box-containing protein [Methanolobus profundi]
MEKKPAHSILIVDDDPLNVKLLETFLSKDYKILKAYSGEDALSIIGMEEVDLVLLDIMMPGIDGYEVCRRIKSSRSTQFIQVVMITALSSRDDRIMGLEAGADEFLVKPIDRIEVITRVKTLLNSKELYDELISERDRAQDYLDISGCMIVAFDSDGTVKLANKKCCHVLGYEESELIGKNWVRDIVPPEDRDGVSSVFSNVVKGNIDEVSVFENSVLTKNGEKRIIHWNNAYMRDSDGNIIGTLSSGSDVTEERMATMRLKASEEKFRILFENAADAIIIFDTDCNIIDVNSVAFDMLGYKEDELLKMSRHDLVAPASYGTCDEKVADVMDDKCNRFEITYMKKDGTLIPVEMGVRVIEYNGISALLSNVRDVSERKNSEKVLKESEQKFRLLAENANDVIWTLDKSGRFNYTSPSVFKLRGYTPDEVAEQTFDEIFPPEHKNTVIGAIARFYEKLEAGAGNYSEKFEIEQYHKDGHRVWTETVANPVYDDEGNFQFFLGVSRDISERKRAEEEIDHYTEELAKKNEELKSLDRMKDEFISNLSHELKTPLISIKGYSELVHDEVLGPLNSRQKNAMKTVLDKYDHLSFLMDSLIYMSIVKSGKVHYRLDPIRVVDSLNKVIDYFKFQSQDKALILLIDIEDDLPLIKGDVEYMPYLFRAIIDNAIKFSQSGSEVLISAFSEDDKVHITVTDSGIGIPKHELPNIFRRFYQVDGSMSRRYGGSGLGLYVSKTIAEIHNGEIWVESDEGKGTTVHVRFPIFRS